MFYYFGFGSNISMASLKAKGVTPIQSQPATLHGWRLRFNVQHFFRNEGGVGNIQYTGSNEDKVLGMLHECLDDNLIDLDAAEAHGYGYNRITLDVETNEKSNVSALTYIGTPEFIDDSCLPSRRYLNIIISGAKQAGFKEEYIHKLMAQPVLTPSRYPKFIPPPGDYSVFNNHNISSYPLYTVLHGHVFDMSSARPHHDYLKIFFGGKDMTLFHLKRLDSSDNKETLDDIKYNKLNIKQQEYLNGFLCEYAMEYDYVGQFNY